MASRKWSLATVDPVPISNPNNKPPRIADSKTSTVCMFTPRTSDSVAGSKEEASTFIIDQSYIIHSLHSNLCFVYDVFYFCVFLVHGPSARHEMPGTDSGNWCVKNGVKYVVA
mmetsp:Transcript_22326/g.48570  ORF Transcript_22326/g.48570 Transcript_22326/m.48570 type:complete len:113 (-) Transcript_22326:100-438(-)